MAHRLIALGHRVKLLTPENVRPFAKAQKNDWNDALAIAEAARRPDRYAVGTKSEEQLDMQALHRVRQRLVTARTAIINQLRGLMRERGIVAPGGRARFERFVQDYLLGGDMPLSPVSRALFATLVNEYETISARLDEIDRGLVLCFPHRSAKIELLPAKPILAGNGGGWIDLGSACKEQELPAGLKGLSDDLREERNGTVNLKGCAAWWFQ